MSQYSVSLILKCLKSYSYLFARLSIGVLLSTLIFKNTALAAQTITLESGQQIRLNDDFTWQYLPAVKPLVKTDTPSIKTNKSADISNIQPTVRTNSTHLITSPHWTTVSLTQTHNIRQISSSGITIIVQAPHYQDGKLILPTKVINNSLQSVISVQLDVQLRDVQQQSLAHQTATVWQSIKRMSNTYLRPEQTMNGRPIKLTVANAKQYQIAIKITDITTR